MYLLIKPMHNNAKRLYQNHTTFHKGDAGLDLFCMDTQVIPAHKTIAINLGIRCQALKIQANTQVNTSYYLYPRSSISKTPLRLANSVGIIDWVMYCSF